MSVQRTASEPSRIVKNTWSAFQKECSKSTSATVVKTCQRQPRRVPTAKRQAKVFFKEPTCVAREQNRSQKALEALRGDNVQMVRPPDAETTFWNGFDRSQVGLVVC